MVGAPGFVHPMDGLNFMASNEIYIINIHKHEILFIFIFLNSKIKIELYSVKDFFVNNLDINCGRWGKDGLLHFPEYYVLQQSSCLIYVEYFSSA